MIPKTTCEPSQTATAFTGTNWRRTATTTATGTASWSFASPPTTATPPRACAPGRALSPFSSAETQHPAPSTSSTASMIVVPGPMIVVQRYEYTGRELASESNEYYFRYRVYGPSLGQFFTRDPLGYVDGMGLYGGVFAGHLTRDPKGEDCNCRGTDEELREHQRDTDTTALLHVLEAKNPMADTLHHVMEYASRSKCEKTPEEICDCSVLQCMTVLIFKYTKRGGTQDKNEWDLVVTAWYYCKGKGYPKEQPGHGPGEHYGGGGLQLLATKSGLVGTPSRLPPHLER